MVSTHPLHYLYDGRSFPLSGQLIWREGPRFAKRKSLMGKLICGGLGKPLGRG